MDKKTKERIMALDDRNAGLLNIARIVGQPIEAVSQALNLHKHGINSQAVFRRDIH